MELPGSGHFAVGNPVDDTVQENDRVYDDTVSKEKTNLLQDNKGLSNGAKAGVAVAGVCGVALIIGLAVGLSGGDNNNAVPNFPGFPIGYGPDDVCRDVNPNLDENGVLYPVTFVIDDSTPSMTDMSCKIFQSSVTIGNGVDAEFDLFSVFPSLEVINGDLTIEGNDGIISVTMRESVSNDGLGGNTFDVLGRIIVSGNNNLASLDMGFLNSVAGSFQLRSNPALTSFGAPYLRSIGSDTGRDGEQPSFRGLDIVNNQVLDDFYGLGFLQSVAGDIFVANNPEIERLFFQQLETVDNNIRIDNMPKLEEFYHGGDLSVGDSVIFENLPLVQEIQIGGGIETGYVSVGGSVIFENLPLVQEIEVAGLVSIGGNLNIINCDTIRELEFSSIITIGGDVLLRDNDRISSTIFPLLQSAGSVTFSDMPTIGLNPSFGIFVIVFSAIRTIGGNVIFENLPLVQEIDVAGLVSISGNLTISDMSGLVDVNFASLSFVEGGILFHENPNLETLNLANLRTVRGYLKISPTILPEEGFVTEAGHPNLRALNLNVLSEVTDFEMSNCGRADRLFRFYLNQPTQVEECRFTICLANSVTLSDNAGLEWFEAQLNTVGDIYIVSNPVLEKVEFPNLREMITYPNGTEQNPTFQTTLSIAQNPTLSKIRFPSLRNGQFQQIGNKIGIYMISNGSPCDCICPSEIYTFDTVTGDSCECRLNVDTGDCE